jgi:hypothetical protein
MVSSAIWKKKHARVIFSKTIKIARVQWIQLLINNIHEKLCSHLRKSHLEIKKIKKFEK